MDNATYLRQRRDERRLKAISLLGGKCVKCGSVNNLHFDHKDPNLKKFNISAMLAGNWTVVSEELSKCQLLCEDCHKQKTRQEAIARLFGKGRHGTMWMYWKHKCRCDECRAYKHSHYKRYAVEANLVKARV